MERDEIVKHVKDILAESVMSGHKHFHNQLYSGYDMYAVVGDMMASNLNAIMATYEMAPVFCLMEN